MKVALVQINTTVGDLVGNSKKILDAYLQAADKGAELIVYPEMAVTGYPPLDLLHRKSFIQDTLLTVQQLAKKMQGPPSIFGCMLENQSPKGRPLYNAAVVSEGGKIRSFHVKTRLPTYDIFNQDHYFEPTSIRKPAKVAGLRIGITVCEDIWPSPNSSMHLYHEDPVEDLYNQGIDLLVNVSASPYNKSKINTREQLLIKISNRFKIPVLLSNLVGGNDSMLFDGTSLAVFPDRGVVAKAKSFEEDMIFVDLDHQTGQLRKSPTSLEDELYRAICMGLGDYVHKCGFESVVIGLSGGIDSAVCTVLATQALGPDKVCVLAMPSLYSSPQSKNDAEQLAKNLGIQFHCIPINKALGAFQEILSPHLGKVRANLTEENLQARIRANLLMAFSNQKHLLTLATGNKSELAVGYCTLYGDMAGAIAPIGDLTKTQVYRLADYINRDHEVIPKPIIQRTPSAELRPDQTDQDALPSYDILDDILELFIEEGLDQSAIIKRGYPASTVAMVIQMVERSEYKRRQAAMVLRVSQNAFGTGRLIPIARKIDPGRTV